MKKRFELCRAAFFRMNITKTIQKPPRASQQETGKTLKINTCAIFRKNPLY